MLVGPTEESAFDNPTGKPIFPELTNAAWDSVLDFGCGCGRLARQLLQQDPRPRRYLGIDLHRGMIQWCQRNLQPLHSDFRFVHHDCFNAGFNPEGKETLIPFPVADQSVTLVIAWSVFTHLLQDQIEFYLREISRVLRPEGYAVTTWFFFDKRLFPMMQSFQNALYINPRDPTNAVICDREWLRGLLKAAGLVPVSVAAPQIRGFQWVVWLRPLESGAKESEFPPDQAPLGAMPPPLCPLGADRLGVVDE